MRTPFLALFLSLTACAAQGPFPSLAPRAAERGLAGGSAPAPCPADAAAQAEVAEAQPVPTPSDPALRARLAALLDQARQGQRSFAEILPRVASSAALAGAAGSDSWIAAQQEISRLDVARTRTADAVAELDSLSIPRAADRSLNAEDYEAVLQAEEEARAIAERQQAELGRLSELAGTP
jgi:Meckel syndrome type 1 protein